MIGGGPAGLMAASRAAECGASAVILERNPKLARKLLISGKGRCNVTNTADLPAFIGAFSPNGKFLYGAFSRFFRDDLLDILRDQGVETKVERGGRVFPVSDRAADVARALESWMLSTGARVKSGTRAKSVANDNGRVIGVEVFGGRMKADAVIIATGGASYPKTGSTGDGYDMARRLGHTIVAPKPALSALVCEEKWIRDIQGLSLKNVEASLWIEPPPSLSRRGAGGEVSRPRRLASEFGEMLFTHFGVSGPIVLILSRGVGDLVKQGRVTISIDLKPALTPEQLHARLIRDFRQTKHIKNYLPELMPHALAEQFAWLAGLDPDKRLNDITHEERQRIVEMLKDLRVTVSRMASLDEAIVTAGGVSLKEIDPRTMMSKLVPGLFFAGEVLDIDAVTGGYNLQAAFSTGYVAGESAAEYAHRISQAGGE